jgi:Arc/MetJ family transcription regulator
MRTTLEIDETLIEEARSLSGAQTKKETIETALKEYIRRRKARQLLNLEGRIQLTYDVPELINRRKKDVPHR